MSIIMIKKLFKTKGSRGQTLIEALIALTAIILIMTGTTVAVITSLSNAGQIKTEGRVDKVAQQGMEYIRNQVVNSGTLFTQYYAINGSRCLSSTYVMTIPTSGDCAAAALIDAKYRRIVTFTPAQCEGAGFTDGLKVRVDVAWYDTKCTGTTLCHNKEVTSCFLHPAKRGVPAMQGP